MKMKVKMGSNTCTIPYCLERWRNEEESRDEKKEKKSSREKRMKMNEGKDGFIKRIRMGICIKVHPLDIIC